MSKHSPSLREKQIIEAAANGMTDVQIARKLGLAPATVATYWVRIRAKFGGGSRTELVASALREGFQTKLTELQEKATDLSSQLMHASGETGDHENLYQAVYDSAPEAIFILNQEGKVEFANAASYELFGYEVGELEGKSIDMLVPERFRRIHGEHMREYFSNPTKRMMGEHLLTVARHMSDQEFPILAYLSHVDLPHGMFVTCFVHLGEHMP